MHRLLALFSCLFLCLALGAADRPNIIVIMVDDMGFSDIGCFGAEIATSNLDRLAANGVRLTGFRSNTRCCPSRACVMTGLYPQQTGLGRFIGKGNNDPAFIAYQGAMRRPNVTMGEVLGPAGYFTAMSGKWHVGNPQAKDRGFDHVEAYFPDGARSYFPKEGSKESFAYITDWFADAVVKHVDDAAKADKPLLVYWAPTAPHWPLHAKASDVEKYKGVYAAGPKAIAEARYQKMQELGIVDGTSDWSAPALLSDQKYIDSYWTEYRLDTDTGPQPNYKKKGWKSGRYDSTRITTRPDECMEVYAAQIDNLDQGIGRVLTALERHGQLDNTLIMFCSDNGCSNESYGTGNAWALVSDTPFLRYKKSAWEGGVASPFIIHWPKHTNDDAKGSIDRRTTGHLVDIMATVLGAAGVAYPTHDTKGRPLPDCEGRSLLPVLKGEHVPLKHPIGIEHGGNRALITEDWKITADGGESWHLFDLRTDRFERKNLAKQHPDKVAELAKLWDAWAERTGARADGGKVSKKRKK